MSQRPLRHVHRVSLALAAALALTACAVSAPTGGNLPADRLDRRPASTKPSTEASAEAGTQASASVAATAAASAAPTPALVTLETPAPLPSLGLLLSGRVTIDASLMLTSGIAEATSGGVKLISNNGPGLISDKGVGLISNNTGNLISDNGHGIVSKTKYAIAQAGETAVNRSLQAVQGMLVKAVSLRTGEIVAGPVATDADGRYRLGFLVAPEGNLRIIAYVNNKETDANFDYAVFAAPVAEPVLTTDTTDLISNHMIKVLAARVQGGIDSRLAGEDPKLDPEAAPDQSSKEFSERLNIVFQNVPNELIVALDRNGATSRKFAERTVSYADLRKPVYRELEAIFEGLREFGEKRALPDPARPAVAEEVVQLLGLVKTLDDIVPTLIARGMPREEAQQYFDRLRATSDDLNEELSRVGLAHSREILLPLFEGPDLEPLAGVIDLLLPPSTDSESATTP